MIVYNVRMFWANVVRDALELGLDTMFQWVSKAVSRLSSSVENLDGPSRVSIFKYALCIKRIFGTMDLNDFFPFMDMCLLVMGLGVSMVCCTYCTRIFFPARTVW